MRRGVAWRGRGFRTTWQEGTVDADRDGGDGIGDPGWRECREVREMGS